MAPRLIADDIRELLPMRREPGHHVSSILAKIARRQGLLPPVVEGDSGPPQIQLEVGNVFETAVARGLADRYAEDQPGRYIHGLELSKSGVTGNADLFDTIDFVIEEVKVTKRSLRTPITDDKFWMNWEQLKTYCYMIGASTGRLHICFVNGNYSKDFSDPLAGWQYRVWEDTWSDKELLGTWRMVYGHREAA